MERPLTSMDKIQAVGSPLQKGGYAVSNVTHRPNALRFTLLGCFGSEIVYSVVSIRALERTMPHKKRQGALPGWKGP
jgi:hypothetical protein